MSVKYGTKSIEFENNHSRILIQNENGPCALIALVNALVLDPTLKENTTELRELLERSNKYVNFDELLQVIASILLKVTTEAKKEDIIESQPKSNKTKDKGNNSYISEILTLLPRLQDGMNINPIFDGGFKESPELVLFKILGVKLVHGWVLTDDTEGPTGLSKLSYDETLDMYTEASELLSKGDKDRNSKDISLLKKVDTLKAFIQGSSTQLTPAGITHLNKSLGNNSLAVLFRNDHFSTLIKKDGILYTLVTDVGYRKQNTIVWETLLSIDGSLNVFVDHDFRESKAMEEINSNKQSINSDQDSAEIADRKIALQLQEEEDRELAEYMAKEKASKVYNEGDKKNVKHKHNRSKGIHPKENKYTHHKNSKKSKTRVKTKPKAVESSPNTNKASTKSSKDSCTII